MCGNETEGAGVPTVDWPACRFCGWAAPEAPADGRCPSCSRWLDGADVDALADATHAGQFGGWTPARDRPYTGPRPRVKLSGTDGNAFAILGRMCQELRKAGATRDQVAQFTSEATSGDYDNLLAACAKYAEIR